MIPSLDARRARGPSGWPQAASVREARLAPPACRPVRVDRGLQCGRRRDGAVGDSTWVLLGVQAPESAGGDGVWVSFRPFQRAKIAG